MEKPWTSVSPKLLYTGGCIIERDGKLFKYILDYLHGEFRLPNDEKTLLALQDEADYFGIPYPCSLAEHLRNEVTAYTSQKCLQISEVLSEVCTTLGFVCAEPAVWVLHYLNTCDASCESKIIGIYTSKIEGVHAVEKQLGNKINKKGMFKREAGNNLQYIWCYYSASELGNMMDAFGSWQGQGISYWRLPRELVECWTLEGRSLKSHHDALSPVQKRRRQEDPLTEAMINRVRASGSSTSTNIKVTGLNATPNVQKTINPRPTKIRLKARKTMSTDGLRVSPVFSTHPPLPGCSTSVEQTGNSSSTLQESSSSDKHLKQVGSRRSVAVPLPKRLQALPPKPVKLKRTPLGLPSLSNNRGQKCAAHNTQNGENTATGTQNKNNDHGKGDTLAINTTSSLPGST
uniref:Potassium channel tetramerization domain containing 18 n=1 Tax=Eptatretus burgeri TaxID=7764 RepID=A0A8C4Q9E6_EPTBU